MQNCRNVAVGEGIAQVHLNLRNPLFDSLSLGTTFHPIVFTV